jgi:hypothetical protein
MTIDLRIGVTEHASCGVVEKSKFARFLAPFYFRLFQQYRPTPEVKWSILLDRKNRLTSDVRPAVAVSFLTHEDPADERGKTGLRSHTKVVEDAHTVNWFHRRSQIIM